MCCYLSCSCHADPPGATTAHVAETYHQCDAATAHVNARCRSSPAIPNEG